MTAPAHPDLPALHELLTALDAAAVMDNRLADALTAPQNDWAAANAWAAAAREATAAYDAAYGVRSAFLWGSWGHNPTW